MPRLSFGCTINHLHKSIAEVIVDSGIELTIEMVEELDTYLDTYYSDSFALLVNKKNPYSYTYEAQLCLASLEKQKAIAVLYYDLHREQIPPLFDKRRKMDNIKIKSFPATKLGTKKALVWLTLSVT
ncbi:hypothetical protein Sps_02942 [Shewanella psychrophila]|uniref:Uncharacterized protein n=1 Tax=Shewanella psychrophila TaxID=225848 RepID=A0A1S6HRD5_9GAMM|nr:hypothetical protein [Shewanella psychrophila]AQS38089.1 hypothetical protein Sps_02942 [Shewanella psychrophila]